MVSTIFLGTLLAISAAIATAALVLPDMLSEGQPIKCSTADPIYRYTGGLRRWYPNPDIADTWDTNWGKFTMVDCTTLHSGEVMKKYAQPPSSISEGQSIKCDPNVGTVYRYASGQVRAYPNPMVATSWDPNWSSFKVVDCSSTPRGADMTFHQPHLVEGQSVRCNANTSDPSIYRYEAGARRFYPNVDIAKSWDPNYSKATLIDCSVIPQGLDKLLSPSALTEGQSIKCDANDGSVYRYTGGIRRWYPNPTIAASWDANWSKFLVVDCSGMASGLPMKYKAAAPSDVPEGHSVACEYNEAMVYRYTSGQVRWYPNPTIASSWDSNWTNYILMDCSDVPRGADMMILVK